MKKPPANWYGSEDWFSVTSTWAGRVRFWIVRIVAAKTSFHERTKVKIAEAAMPGITSGSTTYRKACPGEQPNTIAASSSSYGMLEKTLLNTRIVVGSARAVCISARLYTLS